MAEELQGFMQVRPAIPESVRDTVPASQAKEG
jgi:hypothetical protein